MPELPSGTQHDVVIQNNTTGAVDFLQYTGSTLTKSFLVDYGLGPNWKLVADGNFNADAFIDLVFQNNTTGQLDFLYLDAGAQLTGSFLTVGFEKVVGEGFFGNAPGQQGPALVTQLANGQLDILAFNATGGLVASDLIANTVGLSHVVGVATAGGFGGNNGAFNIGSTALSDVLTQQANGQIDAIAFSGSLSGGTLSVNATQLVKQSTGLGPVFAVDQDFSGGGQHVNENALNPGALPTEGVSFITENTATGQIGLSYFDSGYSDIANIGVLYATETFTPLEPGWTVVDGGQLAHQLFPIA
jgi:hypothetical protein